ncbi:hypothetical protein [Modestobacter versicolor]|uniref:Uncharacterized protein n=1 Tax=Modestobacter versicolor TaxID=429133 RepID=A0A323VEE7_9ACTN|nr:hypothetical protein [Modestobacter versicolor]MBB3677690.1 hypothetical protein [Modestobacter versicolor]PZA21636.1 hypothetical protein DMO24_09195 [Modestobacter versicolor]
MTDLDRDIRTAFDQLADRAAGPRGPETAERAIALGRRQRRRTAGWAAAALTAVVLGVTVPQVLPASGDPGQTAAPSTAGPVGLYAAPTRGSLAGDEEFVAGVRALEWSGPLGVNGADLHPAEDTRRVLFAGDVPGGQRWAVVMGKVGAQHAWAWYVGPAGAAAEDLELAAPPARGGTDTPIALLDDRSATGPLLVLSRPGDEAEYSASLDRDAAGVLTRTFTALPVVDGVPLGEVTTPIVFGAGELHVLRDGVRVDQAVPTTPFTEEPVPAPQQQTGDPARFAELMAGCLEPLGFQVRIGPDGTSSEILSGPYGTGPLSSAEDAETEALITRCRDQLGY